MSRSVSKWVVAAAFAVSFSASAQDIEASQPTVSRGGQGWSLHSGQTVGNGATVLGAQLGWPGLSVDVRHGATSKFDIGGRLTPLNYGFEGRVEDVFVGMKLQFLGKLNVLETSRFNLALKFEPGPLFYFPPRATTRVGLALPVGVTAGIPVGSAILLNFGMDMPMFVIFGRNGGLYLPILFGGGVEYFIDRKLNVAFNLKMGPSIFTPTGRAQFAMDALIGVGYKFN